MSVYPTGLVAVLCESVLRAAPVLRVGILGGMGHEEVKGDGTRATWTDISAQAEMLRVLQRTGLPVIGEEGHDGPAVRPRGRFILVDPTDGTAAGRAGAGTATAGACVYNPTTCIFESAAVVDPCGCRMWFASGGKTYAWRLDPLTLVPRGEPKPCSVSGLTLGNGGEVAIEVSHGFTRIDVFTGERRLVLDGRSATELQYRLQEDAGNGGLGTKVRGWGSNLYHQSLVADGLQPKGPRSLVATAMTAVGGPWDMCGVALVQGAGGVARFARVEGGKLQPAYDPLMSDMVVCANTTTTARAVLGVQRGVVYAQAARLAS
jgi:fructose-1,6-bisphosphatase/inositol monophosphatase family enzyme